MFRDVLGVVVLILLVTGGGLSADERKPGEKWAVLVGVNKYEYAQSLEYCVSDMRALRDELVRSGFDRRQVLLLEDEPQDKRLQPTRTHIQTQIELACGNAEPGDLVLIAFSGHGLHLEDVSYLCPSDARVDDPQTLVSLNWVYQQLKKSRADLRLVMVDACRNVPAASGGTRAVSPADLQDGRR
ncbi:MAG: caspase family protein, partial [Planctomycetes bacterium]|nr:caspase family protein [Planctomycetota bacterium]